VSLETSIFTTDLSLIKMLLIQKVVFSGCVRAPRGHHLRQDVRELRLRPEPAQLQQGHQTWGGSNVQLQLQLLKQKTKRNRNTETIEKHFFLLLISLNWITEQKHFQKSISPKMPHFTKDCTFQVHYCQSKSLLMNLFNWNYRYIFIFIFYILCRCC
jgi:hypothetical protein